jgi:hypothetical protein
MNVDNEKLEQLKTQLKNIVRDAQSGKLDNAKAAEKILEVREEIDEIVRRRKPFGANHRVL